MPRLRLSLGALVAAVATLVAMMCLPAPAFALPPPGSNISIISAGPTSGNPYQLTVQVNDANNLQLSSPDGGTTPPMTVHVFNSSKVDVYDVTTMAYVSGPNSAQIWQQTDQIPQASLPAGTYTLKIDMYDAQESDLAVVAPTAFSFSYTTSFSNLQANPPTVTAGSQNVTISGTVTGQATVSGFPPSGPTVGLGSGITVNVSANGSPVGTTTTTDTAGDFSYQATGIAQNTTYTFSVGSTSTYSAATSPPVAVDTVQATTAISATANFPSVSEGSPPVTISGRVTVTAQGSMSSSGIGSGVPVNVAVNGVPTTTVNTTDAAGDFSYPAGLVSADTTYTFSVAQTPLYTSASMPVPIQVNQAPSTMVVTPSPTSVTYGTQNVNFAGTATAVPPGSSNPVPVLNESVYLDGGTTPIATTDGSGKFTYQAPAATVNTTYTFSINSNNLHSGYSDPVPVPAVAGTTNMTVTANPPSVPVGSPSTVNLNGLVTVSTSALPVPPNTPVYLNGGATPVANTDSTGDFTYQATGVTPNTKFHFSANAGTLYTAATYDVSVNLAQLTTNLTVTPSQTSVTEGSQTVTFHGTVTGTTGTSGPRPIAGVPIYLTGLTTSQVATSDQNGNFTYVVSGMSDTAQFNFSVASTPTYTAATWNVAIGVVPAITRLTGVHVVPAHLKYGEKGTITGAVQYRNGTTWTALPGGTVNLFEGKTSLGSVNSRKDGSFTASLPTTHGPAWRATLSSAILWQQASAIGNLSISVPMKVKYFAASLSVLGSIKAAGCLQVTVPVRYGPESKIDIQYSTGSRGPWKELGRLPLHNVAGAPALCRDANESYFGGSIRAKLANSYYRADYPGSYSFQPTVSSVIHAWRYQTRITDYKVSPRAISTGDKLRISGRLWVRGRIWKPYGKRKVEIIYNEKGTSYWGQLPAVKTSYGGYFSETGVGTPGKFVAIFYAFYPGSKTDLAVMSIGVPVAINEGSTTSAAPQPTATTGGLPLISLPTYRGLGMLAQDAVDIATREITALAFWPR